MILQTQDFRVDQEKKPCIRVNTRELNRVLCIGLSILYTQVHGLCSTTLAYSEWSYICLKVNMC